MLDAMLPNPRERHRPRERVAESNSFSRAAACANRDVTRIRSQQGKQRERVTCCCDASSASISRAACGRGLRGWRQYFKGKNRNAPTLPNSVLTRALRTPAALISASSERSSSDALPLAYLIRRVAVRRGRVLGWIVEGRCRGDRKRTVWSKASEE